MGLGGVLISEDGDHYEISEVAPGWGCNNEAELRALIALLALAIHRGVRRLQVYGDNDFVIGSAQGFTDGHVSDVPLVARLVPLLDSLRSLLAEFDHVDCRWLPRHRNGEADQLSRRALGLPAKKSNPPSNRKRSRRR